jgi:hypothetical protein
MLCYWQLVPEPMTLDGIWGEIGETVQNLHR